jgi:hypothetical protein
VEEVTALTQDRINLAVVAKSPIERIRAFARTIVARRSRAIRFPRSTSSHGTDGGIHHFYNAELLYFPWTGGEQPRHDLAAVEPARRDAGGAGTDWNPKLSYAGTQGRQHHAR